MGIEWLTRLTLKRRRLSPLTIQSLAKRLETLFRGLRLFFSLGFHLAGTGTWRDVVPL